MILIPVSYVLLACLGIGAIIGAGVACLLGALRRLAADALS